jgi:hypothetical protein
LRLFSRLRSLQLAHFSKPIGDRPLYRAIATGKVRSILEIGLGPTVRSLRMIELAQRLAAGDAIRYVAIDLFEGRPKSSAPGLSLKEAHRVLKATGAKLQLIPGDPASALARSANSLQKIDLILIAAHHDEASMARAWFYLPRMLATHSAVYLEESAAGAEPTTTLQRVAPADIEARTVAARRRAA